MATSVTEPDLAWIRAYQSKLAKFVAALLHKARSLGHLASGSPQLTAAGWQRAISKYICLVERHPTAILDSIRLPLPKDHIETILKSAWLAAQDQAERDFLETAYVRLAQFQENAGRVPIDGYVPPNADSCKTTMILKRYSEFCRRTGSDMDRRKAAFEEFKRRVSARESLTQAPLETVMERRLRSAAVTEKIRDAGI